MRTGMLRKNDKNTGEGMDLTNVQGKWTQQVIGKWNLVNYVEPALFNTSTTDNVEDARGGVILLLTPK